ncbi:hypothetical protein [Silvibacterium acidisoli]|uniref:hypothetical protein n=1 Tax=Acidobacteriaceae bacterium ZG23-2 TaxID=2883246 RepID=UPI00406C9B3F
MEQLDAFRDWRAWGVSDRADAGPSCIDCIVQCSMPAEQAFEDACMEQDAPHIEAHEEIVDRNATSTTAKMRRSMDSRDMR